jgi:iron complex transport system substrate-binding protein
VNPVRVCSLLPSATEIVFALGLGKSLVGVTHECDYPPETARIPKVTRSNIPPQIPSGQIENAVSSALSKTGSLYELDLPLLEDLRPDVILTQRLCDVCAVSFDLVQEAAKNLPSRPTVINLEPHSLADILENIRTVENAIGRAGNVSGADDVVRGLESRIIAVREKTRQLAKRPRVFCMEWVDPPYCGGHWMKELVEIAGGTDELANLHRPSYRIEWKRVLAFAPEIVVLTCCGFNLERVQQEAEILAGLEGFHDLPAAKTGRVYATDGSAYFSRPGPRIVDSLEILAHLVHPQIFPAPPLPGAFAVAERARLTASQG